MGEKSCNLVVFYRSPIQDQHEFDFFFPDNSELTPNKLARNNSFFLAAIGDLNGK